MNKLNLNKLNQYTVIIHRNGTIFNLKIEIKQAKFKPVVDP